MARDGPADDAPPPPHADGGGGPSPPSNRSAPTEEEMKEKLARRKLDRKNSARNREVAGRGTGEATPRSGGEASPDGGREDGSKDGGDERGEGDRGGGSGGKKKSAGDRRRDRKRRRRDQRNGGGPPPENNNGRGGPPRGGHPPDRRGPPPNGGGRRGGPPPRDYYGRGGGGPPPPTRDYYGRGGGPPDHHGDRGPPPPGYYGDRGPRHDDRRGPPPRGGGRGGPPDDYYGRGPPRGGGGWDGPRDDRRGPPPRGGGRDPSPPRGRGRDGPPRRGGGPGGVRGDIYGRDRGPPPRGGRRTPSPGRRDSRSASRSPSGSASYSRSRSRSGSRSYSSRSQSRSRSRSRSYSRSYSRSLSPPRGRGGTGRRPSESRSRSPDPPSDDGAGDGSPADARTKDQRTVFLSQLVMRADERDVRRHFRRAVGVSVRDVQLLRDKRTGRHRGCAYVELGSLTDVTLALASTGTVPDFQRFPILVKHSEAEKNAASGTTALGIGGDMSAASSSSGFGSGPGSASEAQKVYVGSIDAVVTQAQLYALFSAFGPLQKVLLQMDPLTGQSRGFAFLSYRDARDANLAIRTMGGQVVAGRQLKTGWANQQMSGAGVAESRSDDLPPDADRKLREANAVMVQLTGAGIADLEAHRASAADAPGGRAAAVSAAAVPGDDALESVANAALDAAFGGLPAPAPAGASPGAMAGAAGTDASVVGRADRPSRSILIHNMFDKDEETDEGWEDDIRLDLEEECGKHGRISRVVVMSAEPGGRIYASFETEDGAAKCAAALAGRWFDKRQLRVEFVNEGDVPPGPPTGSAA